MPRIMFGLLGTILLVSACGATDGVPLGAAESCARSGGTWRPALEMCERGSGGGGGY